MCVCAKKERKSAYFISSKWGIRVQNDMVWPDLMISIRQEIKPDKEINEDKN